MLEPAIDILNLTCDLFIACAGQQGVSDSSARDAYRRVMRRGGSAPVWAGVSTLPLAETHIEDETVKFTLRLPDGLETESVIIPMNRDRADPTRTLCVSSQVGCAMGCVFCETAQMGLMRNLTTAQIVAQWYAARFQINQTIKNIVFMGMGEPMENLDAVIPAIRVLADHNGPAIAASNMTVSTVGRVEGINRLADLVRSPGFGRLNLAVSINAPNDEIRCSIMPINRSSPMNELMDAMLAWPKRRGAAICIEYVLIPGVNDAPEHVDQICEYLKPLRCSLNVIAYNPRRDSPWPAPTEESVQRFINRALANGQFVKRRHIKGRTVMAACGQLGNEHIRKRKYVELSAE